MNKKGSAWVFIILLVIFIALVFALGFYGGKQAEKENSQCSLGIKDKICWVWETQVYEETTVVESGLEDESGGSVGIG